MSITDKSVKTIAPVVAIVANQRKARLVANAIDFYTPRAWRGDRYFREHAQGSARAAHTSAPRAPFIRA